MIDQKYLELINRDIDNAISDPEKEVLDEYLKGNPEGYNMHQELYEIDRLLDKIPEKEPSENLKHSILNSIDVNLYFKKKTRIRDYFFLTFSGTKKKVNVSFALGLLTGIICLSLVLLAVFYNHFTDEHNVLGTIGLTESKVLESVNVNSPEVIGKIDIIKAASQYAITVNLNSPGKYTLQIKFDQESFKIENPGGRKAADNSYSLLLPAKEVFPHKLLLSISREDNKLFEKEIFIDHR